MRMGRFSGEEEIYLLLIDVIKTKTGQILERVISANMYLEAIRLILFLLVIFDLR
jgi:hypothetical protein